jgi:large subunit ribosomal protein L31
MKKNTHPNYEIVRIQCACGSGFETRSTMKGPIQVDICSSCHPHFTGKQRFVDTAGRIDRFQKKFEKFKAKK